MPSLGSRALQMTSLVLAVLAASLGAYLLAWAWRWPHTDMRNVWASGIGTCAILAAGGAGVVAVRVGRSIPVIVAAAASAIAIAVALYALAAVGDGQRAACGDVLPACDSLLPGL